MSEVNGAGAPRVLVVDDEVLVRKFVEFSLVEAGFTVLAVARKDALATLDAQAATLSALITGIGIGAGTSGWEIAAHARNLNPHMPVVYLSGYDAGDWPAKGVPGSLMLQKPVASAEVVAALSDLLNTSRT